MDLSVELSYNMIHRINVGDTLTRSAQRSPKHPAVVDAHRSLSYEEFNSLVNQISHTFLAMGLNSGDALALMSRNSIEFLSIYYACAKLGLVCVPINLLWRPDEVGYVLGHSKAKAIAMESAFLDGTANAISAALDLESVIVIDYASDLPRLDHPTKVVSLAEILSPRTQEPQVIVSDHAPLSYLYTSGTTSAPKGVVSSQSSVYVQSLGVALDLSFSQSDRIGAMMPMFHTAQLNAFCTPAIAVGATLYIMAGFDPATLLGLIDRESLTIIFGLPMMYRAMLEHEALAESDLSSLRLGMYAMAPMPEGLLRRCISTFDCGFALLFGQTEMAPVATIFRPEHQLTHLAAAGTPGINTSVAILDENGEELQSGEIGEICYRSPQVMSGYLDNEHATAEAFRGGWFHSGDLGRKGDDGVLWFEDRSKDVIKSGGENVASLEVERAIYQADPAISEVVVVGLPHEHWSEAITAVVVAKQGQTIDPTELSANLRKILDPYKIPKAFIMASELPHTSTGKIQKHLVRQTYAKHFDGA